MKNLLTKIGVLFALLLTITTASFSDNNISQVPQIKNIDSRFLLEGKKLIDPRTVEKIEEIGNELFSKTGVNLLIHLQDSYSIAKFKDIEAKRAYIKEFEQDIVDKLDAPFILFTMAVKNKHVNIITSDELKSIVDRDDVLNNFVVPILVSKDKNTNYAKVSVAIFNGYAEISDSVAEAKGIELKSSVGSGNTDFTSIWRWIMYFIVISGLSVYTYAYIRQKRIK